MRFGIAPSVLLSLGLMLPPTVSVTFASRSIELALGYVETKRHRASPLDAACVEPVVLKSVFLKTHSG
jgi:hypothetical protein